MAEYDSWAADYDAWSAELTDDIPYDVGPVREADGPVVELMVGTGRDSSRAMLAIARDRAGDGAEGLLEVSGLEVEALSGSFDRRPFDESSPEMVWVARKP